MADIYMEIDEDLRIRGWLEENLEPLLLMWLRKELTNEDIILKIDELLDRVDLPRDRGFYSAPASDILRNIRQELARHSERYEHKARAYFQEKKKL
jgi:hypothetical protein